MLPPNLITIYTVICAVLKRSLLIKYSLFTASLLFFLIFVKNDFLWAETFVVDLFVV